MTDISHQKGLLGAGSDMKKDVRGTLMANPVH